ncbi:MAG: hypothetical protein RhofKO_31260 [Rhodothermales bacterium]
MRNCILLATLVLLAPLSLHAQSAPLQAQRLGEAPIIDGDVTDRAWQDVQPVRGFRQVEPDNGEPAGLATTVWLGFDNRNLYIAAHMADTTGLPGIRVPDLRRDFDWDENDLFAVVLDPFNDARSAISFQVTPRGTLRDLLVTNGNGINSEWDAVWEARTQITDAGWSVEMAIPWATLRYPNTPNPVWGVNFVRKIRRSSEIHAWQPYPRALNPYYMDFAGTMEGLTPPPPARNLRVQPYLTVNQSRVGSDTETTPDIGGELKWAITPNTVLDATINTDFAQADADRQVINLSRFSVFFPERRAFFLENAELFQVGSTLAVLPFFSRRIGLDNAGQPIPIDAGARFVSRTASRSIGGIAMHQQEQGTTPARWFGVGRYLQNVGKQGRIGGLVTLRQDAALGEQDTANNATFTVDGYARPGSFIANWLVSKSATDGDGGDGIAAYAWLSNRTTWGYIGHVQSIISDDYNAGVGFVGRRDLIVSSPAVTLDLRPSWRPSFVRNFAPGFTGFVYHEYSTRRFQEASVSVRPINMILQNGAQISPYLRLNWQHLNAAEAAGFRPLGLSISADDYQFTQYGFYLASDLSRKVAAVLDLQTGPYFDGQITTATSFLQLAPSPHLAFRLDYIYNRITDLGPTDASATSHLIIPELRLALNPRMQINAFYQYNTFADQGAWNVRFAWEFSPLSYLYLVFNDSRYFVDDTLRRGNPERFAIQQQAIFKVSYLRQL